MDAVEVVPGFSLINRWLLYSSFMLAPAQFASGIGSNCPSNIGFLAYSWYTQISWYFAVQHKELHAVSMLLPHLNTVFAIAYLGGVSSGNIFSAVIAGVATAGLIILNNVTSWIAWSTIQPEGLGVFQFFFFGWRTLDEGWHKFFALWHAFNSVESLIFSVIAITVAVVLAMDDMKESYTWLLRYPLIPIGAAVALFLFWPLILWTELIISRNNIDSPTDWIAVWLFVAQVATMIIPVPF